MAIINEHGEIVNSRNKLKKKKLSLSLLKKEPFPEGTKVWWLDKKSPWDLYDGIVINKSNNNMRIVLFKNRRTKEEGEKTINIKQLRNQ